MTRGGDRLDRVLVERGLAPTREKAQGLVLAGRVRVRGVVVDKAGARVGMDAEIEIEEGPRWVGRGGLKLEHALRALAVTPAGRRCLDVGASTGGFTQVLLAAGAAQVVALDVGHGQLDWGLRNDPRVLPVEGVNARQLTRDALPWTPSLAVVDVSFISLRTVLPAVAACLEPPGDVVALVKPQFEVGRARVGRGGIVRDPALHREVLHDLAAWAGASGLPVRGACASPIRGAEGNAEFFLHLATQGPGLSEDGRRMAVDAALAATPEGRA